MRKRRFIILAKALLLGIIFVAGVFWITTTSLAVCINYDTAMEAAYTECYSKIVMDPVQGSPLEAEAADGVDTSTGKLTLLREDLSLEGMAGMDLNLTRYYDSKKANIGKAIAQEKKNFAMDTVRVSFTTSNKETHEIVVNTAIYKNHADALKDMFVSYKKQEDGKNTTEKETQQTKLLQSSDYNVYGISTGWAFDFPWIETMTFGSNTTEYPLYLHYGSIGSMRIATDENNKITGLKNYDYQDIKLEDFNQTVDGVSCRYLLRDKTGLRTYFNKDGVVVMQKDNHDNTIRFTYRNKIYFDTITDTVGRKMKFDYTESPHGLLLLDKITVEGKKVAGGVSKKTIRYKSSETSYTSIRGGKMYGSKLNSATVDGTKENYTYRTVESFANTCGAGVASQRAVTNETYLIQGAEENGCIRRYEYRAGAVRSKSINNKQERDVVTQHYYVTREYEQSGKNARKKANGLKYDYFQKQTDSKNKTTLVSYDDLNDEKHEMQAYGTKKLQCMTLVSSYNPNKKAKDKKFTDYTFAKKDINISTLQLKKKPKRSTMINVYNTNRLLLQATTEEKRRVQTEYTYDKGGAGSLMLYKVFRNYGTKRTGAGTSSTEGLTYDIYRNVVTSKERGAFKDKYKGKEKLFTTIYTYHGDGYPAADKGYVLNQKKTIESYENETTKSKNEFILAGNGVDIDKSLERISTNGADYQIINMRVNKYDDKGNLIENKYYPSYRTEGMGSVIEYDYQYNQMGQLSQKSIKRTSEAHPSQNESYVEQETQYDFFGNVVSITNQKGIVSVYDYDEVSGEMLTQTDAKGTIYETENCSAHTEDDKKSMSLDSFNRCVVNIYDDFGNVLINKDEKDGTWTESEYDYDISEESSGETENEEEDSGSSIRLVEERTYAFNPTEKKILENQDGTKEYNYDIAGRGDEILSAKRYTYDSENEQIIVAEFSGGSMDAKHCSSWVMTKEEETIGEDGLTTTVSYEKHLNPQHYKKDVEENNYYNQFDECVLDEIIVKTVTDEEGNTLSEITTEIADNEKEVSETIKEYDIFGNVVEQSETVQASENGKAKNKSEVATSYEYDYQGNITQTTTKSRKDVDESWVTTTTKATFDDQGQMTASYDARGVKEGYATRYEYDLSGQQVKEHIPVEKKDGVIIYQTYSKEYDEDGNVIAEEAKQSNSDVQRTEYVYDIMGQLIQVKDIIDSEKAIYAQYLYDCEGNKIRQYTGLTHPLSITLKEGKGDNSYTYMGKEYHVEVLDKGKRNTYSETKYEYDKGDQLISYTDAEGNEENYTYDVYGNLIKTIDKNGNTIIQTYDYQNRLKKQEATEREAKKKTTHTYTYDNNGNMSKIDNRRFTYGKIHGQITSEKWDIGKKSLEKEYLYDSDGTAINFGVKIDGQTELSYNYEYDGESKLKKIVQTDGNKYETVAAYEYDANGILIKENNTKTDTVYEYNLNGRVSRMENKKSDGVLLSEYNASYAINGQKTKETEAVRTSGGTLQKKTSQYTYDLLGRLTKESHTGEEDIFYTYDAHNNREEMKTASQIISYRYNKNNELQRCNKLNRKTERVGVTLYKYDNNGNQLATVNRRAEDVTKTTGKFNLNVSLGDNRLNDNAVNHYNALNQQQETVTKNYKISYTYDDEGLRTSKTVNGNKRYYIWDDEQLIMELDAKGNVVKRYVRGQNLIYSDSGKGTERQYFVQDAHGSVVQLLNEDGSITKRYAYDAFGNEIEKEKSDNNAFRYCGEYYDKETDTVYLRARSYDSGTGRFLTVDTYTGEDENISSLNLYTYCNNDSVNQVDPSGHWGKTDGFGVREFGQSKKDGYVHKSITMEAFKLANNYIPPIPYDFRYKRYMTILEGSILPDYVQAGKKRSKYQFRYIKHYTQYDKGKICGFNMLGKKGKDTFHGKCMKYLVDLRNRAMNQFGKSRHRENENHIFLGCVLHAIQDYRAHSYITELKAYKDRLKTKKGYQAASAEEKAMVEEFHKDWEYSNTKNGKKVNRNKKIHKNNKDNPYMNCVNQNGEWKWIEVKPKKAQNNPRYANAVNSSRCYIKRAQKILK